ncbi:copper chaperone PCu(A)C [Aureimonas psammosilenae]|uniref:copper chaperone PCu(A)C n=1 Tax=Aureimonas psammosilenae TaxID=2495496 RepID=UPI0012611E57|nr:copper chaperone PCu(A)C [Aureimonas psammosilenae]
MSVFTRAAAVFALSLLAFSPSAFAHEFKAGSVEIGHPWSRATPPGAKVGAGYLTLKNEGSTPDRLVSATSPASAKVEVHEMAVKDGVMTMRPVTGGVEIPPGQTVAFKPSSFHLMLTDLKAPLKTGDKVPLTLIFEKGGAVEVYLQVEKMTAADSKDGE